MPSLTVRNLGGLRELASEYDAFLVDLWGVIHDGVTPFAGVIDALAELRAARKRVVFVTNSSRAGDLVESMLTEMRIDRSLYTAVVSSGDVTRDVLAARAPSLFDRLPESPRCFHVGAPSFVPWLFELGLPFVDRLEDADLVVATGTVPGHAELEVIRQELAPAAARGALLVCTNPDPIVPSARGVILGPGAVAAAYADLGGTIFLYGKPHPPIYAAARRHIAEVPTARIVALGDLLETDILGARTSSLASVLVTGSNGGHTKAALDPVAEVAPDMLLELFVW